jgi:hypothetical protein
MAMQAFADAFPRLAGADAKEWLDDIALLRRLVDANAPTLTA